MLFWSDVDFGEASADYAFFVAIPQCVKYPIASDGVTWVRAAPMTSQKASNFAPLRCGGFV